MKKTYIIVAVIFAVAVTFCAYMAYHTRNEKSAMTVSSNDKAFKGKPRFTGLFISWPDGGYVGVPDASSYWSLKDRIKDKAKLRKFECWSKTEEGKTSYDTYNSTVEWSYCKETTLVDPTNK